MTTNINTNTAKAILLDITDLTMRFGGVIAVDSVSLVARHGDITAIIGPNGAGKTTLFNCITGFYKPTKGAIILHTTEGTRDLAKTTGYKIAKIGKVARTFQNIRLFSGMTVLENLLVAQHNELMRASGYSLLAAFGIGNYHAHEKKSIELAKYWMDITGLTPYADGAADQLPYGKQRLLEICRAMCTKPRLLCLDEPAAGLNPRETSELTELINVIRNNHNCGILLIEHDMSMVMRISDRIVVLDYGKKIADGTPAEIRINKEVINAYLGAD